MEISLIWNVDVSITLVYTFEVTFRGSPHRVMTDVLNCNIIINEFDLQSRYYVHFLPITLGKGMKPVIPLVIS